MEVEVVGRAPAHPSASACTPWAALAGTSDLLTQDEGGHLRVKNSAKPEIKNLGFQG